MKNKLQFIIDHFGLKNQREYLGKEYQELQDELLKYVEMGNESDILTEVADVMVLCLQFLYDYGYDEEDLVEEINFKVDRTIKRIKEGYYNDKEEIKRLEEENDKLRIYLGEISS